MRGFYIRAPFPVIAKLDAAVAFFAQLLAAPRRHQQPGRTPRQGRLILANPVHALDLLKRLPGLARQPTGGRPPAKPEVD